MSRTRTLATLLAASSLVAPAAGDDLVGSWRADSFAVSAGPQSADMVAMGGAFTATLDGDSRYVLTSQEPGSLERQAEAGVWTRLSETGIAIQPDGEPEGVTLQSIVAADQLTLSGPVEVDVDGDGTPEAGQFEARFTREAYRIAEGSGVPGAWVRAGGRIRTYRLHRPAPAADGARLPLALVLHGQGADGGDIRRFSGLDAIAEASGFAVAYPDAVDGDWAAGCDCASADERGIDDVGFADRLVEQLDAAGWVEPQRVVVAGFSLGALMSQRIACERSERLVGLVAVAGGHPVPVADACALERPLSVTLVHGSADPVVPYEGRAGILSAPDTLTRWAAANGCATLAVEPVPDRVDDGTSLRVDSYSDCAGGTATALITVEGGGHTWPGSATPWPAAFGPVSLELQASEAIAALLSVPGQP